MRLPPSITPLSRNAAIVAALARKDLFVRHFGTVRSFDATKGMGSIQPESGGENLEFERDASTWDRRIAPSEGQRLSYELGTKFGETRAVKLQNA